MKLTTCDYCHQSDKPLNDTLLIGGKTVCSKCIEIHFTDQKALEKMHIVRQQDPTVCFSCGTDNGETDLPVPSSYPVCANCEHTIKNRTFPTWVKAFFAAVIAIVVFSVFWNWRFYSAYNALNAANATFATGDIRKAADLYKTAADNVPEVKDLEYLRAYCNGIALMNEDKSAEALAEFEKCRGNIPEDYGVDGMILRARMGVGFDTKNYALFASSALKVLDTDTTLAMAWASVASANACLYATQGNDSLRTMAWYYLNRAKELNNTDPEHLAYYDMIEYRIETKDIISRELFNQRFPKGWKRKS